MHTDVVYLDNNATTRPDPAVVEAMLPYWRDYFGNPSSVHSFGAQLGPVLDEAREVIASAIGADGREIAFTSGGTESDNWAVIGSLHARPARQRVIVSTVEHKAVLECVQRLHKQGVEVGFVGVDQGGQLDLAQLADLLTGDAGRRTAVVSIMHANNETGVIFPLDQVGQVIRQSDSGAWLHVDATQTVGKLPIDVAAWGVDLLTGSAHKLHGPKGVGFLFVRRGVRLRPMLVGGPQERDRRAGTENVAGIVGFAHAVRLMLQRRPTDAPRVARLRDRLENGLAERIPDIHINGGQQPRTYNTSNIGFIGVEAEPILILLSENGIAASAGSACTSGSLEPSHVLRAMGLPQEIGHGSIRFSLSRETTDAEIDRVLELMPGIINRLRALNTTPTVG